MKVRPHLIPAKIGEVTQGTVFNCVDHAKYESKTIYGLAITARCDVAQDKFPVLNYLPVVLLSDWLRRDGLEILLENETADQTGNLKSALKAAELSPSILQTVTLDEIIRVHFADAKGSKAVKKAGEKFVETANARQQLQKLVQSQDLELIYGWFKSNHPAKIEELIKRLIRHQVLGHYFLESLSTSVEERVGYVCLLRESTSLPKKIAQGIASGLTAETAEQILGSSSSYRPGIRIPHGDLAMPVIQIGSPTIEHIMQTYANLFGRIGVSDPIDEDVERLISQCLGPSSTEGTAK